MRNKNAVTYVTHLPDLMTPEDYRADREKKVRFQLRITDEGIEIHGDSPYPHLLDELLEALEAKEIEKVLCG